MQEIGARRIKKVPALRGKTVVNLFLEPSTRTRTSFEIAEKRLSADTLNIAGAASSLVKGETLADMARTLEAMAPDLIVVRHGSSGACHLLAGICNARVVNAGDGMHEHPHAGAPRRVHDPRAQAGGGRAHGDDRRRSAAQPGAALEHPAAPRPGGGGARVRTRDADAPGQRALRRARHDGRRTRRWPAPTW